MNNLYVYAQAFPFVLGCSTVFFLLIAVSALNKKLRTIGYNLFLPLSSQSTNYFASLDAFRGLSALWVASFHIWQFLVINKKEGAAFPLGHGINAVAVFATISAFVIYHSVRDGLDSLADVGSFFKRRLLRIYPLYVVTTGTLFFAGYLPGGMFFRELFMLKTFTYGPFINPVTWSLQAELIFYLILPIGLLWLRKQAPYLAVAGLAACFLLANAPREIGIIKFFFIGVLCYEISRSRPFMNAPQMAGYALFAAGAIFLYIGLFTREPLNFFIGLGFSLLLLGTLKSNLLTGIFSAKPFRFLGAISYSIFLWHIFVLNIDSYYEFDMHGITTLGGVNEVLYQKLSPLLTHARTPVIYLLYIPAILLISSISYLVIERPFHKLKYAGPFNPLATIFRALPDFDQGVRHHWKPVAIGLVLVFMTVHYSITRSISIDPIQYCLAGISDIETNKPERAIPKLETAVSLKPDFVSAYKYLASAYEMAKKYEQAAHAYQAYLRLQPDDYDSRERLRQVRAFSEGSKR